MCIVLNRENQTSLHANNDKHQPKDHAMTRALGFALLILAGCVAETPDELPPSPPITTDEACEGLSLAWCYRANDCEPSYPRDVCVRDFVIGCCEAEGTCSDTVIVEDDRWYGCLEKLAALSCSLVADGFLPTECRFLPITGQ